MLLALIFAAGAPAVSAAALPDANTPEAGLRTALTACEAWLLEPSTWTDGIDGFPVRAKLSAMQPQAGIPEVALPPVEFRQNLHSWRVPVGEGGYYVTTSDTSPVCYVVGGGPLDFEPGVETLLNSVEFKSKWTAVKQKMHKDTISSQFVSKVDPALGMLLTRADRPGSRTDRGQLVATVTYEIRK